MKYTLQTEGFPRKLVQLSGIRIPHRVLRRPAIDSVLNSLYMPLSLADLDLSQLTPEHTVVQFGAELHILSQFKSDSDFQPYEKSEFTDPDRHGHRQLMKWTVHPMCGGLQWGFDKNGHLVSTSPDTIDFWCEQKSKVVVVTVQVEQTA